MKIIVLLEIPLLRVVIQKMKMEILLQILDVSIFLKILQQSKIRVVFSIRIRTSDKLLVALQHV